MIRFNIFIVKDLLLLTWISYGSNIRHFWTLELNSVNVFFQLRSSNQDKEEEARHTELIRSYLSLDVEMAKAKSDWDKSESMITEFNQHQNLMRAKHRMLKEDLERFKAQRKDQEKQLKSKEAGNG